MLRSRCSTSTSINVRRNSWSTSITTRRLRRCCCNYITNNDNYNNVITTGRHGVMMNYSIIIHNLDVYNTSVRRNNNCITGTTHKRCQLSSVSFVRMASTIPSVSETGTCSSENVDSITTSSSQSVLLIESSNRLLHNDNFVMYATPTTTGTSAPTTTTTTTSSTIPFQSASSSSNNNHQNNNHNNNNNNSIVAVKRLLVDALVSSQLFPSLFSSSTLQQQTQQQKIDIVETTNTDQSNGKQIPPIVSLLEKQVVQQQQNVISVSASSLNVTVADAGTSSMLQKSSAMQQQQQQLQQMLFDEIEDYDIDSFISPTVTETTTGAIQIKNNLTSDTVSTSSSTVAATTTANTDKAAAAISTAAVSSTTTSARTTIPITTPIKIRSLLPRVQDDILISIEDSLRNTKDTYLAVKAFRRLMTYIDLESKKRKLQKQSQSQSQILSQQENLYSAAVDTSTTINNNNDVLISNSPSFQQPPTQQTQQQQQQQQPRPQRPQQSQFDPSQKTFLSMPDDLLDINFIGVGKIHQLFKVLVERYPFDAYRALLYEQTIRIHKINEEKIMKQEQEQEQQELLLLQQQQQQQQQLRNNNDSEINDSTQQSTTYQQQQQQQTTDEYVFNNNDFIDRNDPEFYYKLRIRMYQSLCKSIHTIPLTVYSNRDIYILLSTIIYDIQTTLNKFNMEEGVQRCFPLLISSLLQMKSDAGKSFVPVLYNYIQDNNIIVSPGWYEHILSLSKYFKQDVLPFGQVMHDAVIKNASRPCAQTIMTCIDNLYPYNDFQQTKLALISLRELIIQQKQLNEIQEENEIIHNSFSDINSTTNSSSSSSLQQHANNIKLSKWQADLRKANYIMDIGTLESITNGAVNQFFLKLWKKKEMEIARNNLPEYLRNQNDFNENNINNNNDTTISPSQNENDIKSDDEQTAIEVIMLVWDLLDLYKYTPTVGMYENAASLFIGYGPDTYHQGFSLLFEMDRLSSNTNSNNTYSPDMKPTLAFIRSLSVFLREDAKYIISAREVLQKIHNEQTTPVSASSLNVILAGLAERGVATVAMTVFAEDFKQYNTQRNEDTYALVLEALGKTIRRYKRLHFDDYNLESLCSDVLADAEYVLSRMDEDNIKPTQSLINEYASLLCQANEVKTATDVLFDAAAVGTASATATSTATGKSKSDSNISIDDEISSTFDDLLVTSKAVYNLATENIKLHKYDIARKLSILYPFGTKNEQGTIISSIPNLTYNIDRYEREYNLKQELLLEQQQKQKEQKEKERNEQQQLRKDQQQQQLQEGKQQQQQQEQNQH